jgi:hypothetical protein
MPPATRLKPWGFSFRGGNERRCRGAMRAVAFSWRVASPGECVGPQVERLTLGECSKRLPQ